MYQAAGPNTPSVTLSFCHLSFLRQLKNVRPQAAVSDIEQNTNAMSTELVDVLEKICVFSLCLISIIPINPAGKHVMIHSKKNKLKIDTLDNIHPDISMRIQKKSKRKMTNHEFSVIRFSLAFSSKEVKHMNSVSEGCFIFLWGYFCMSQMCAFRVSNTNTKL